MDYNRITKRFIYLKYYKINIITKITKEQLRIFLLSSKKAIPIDEAIKKAKKKYQL